MELEELLTTLKMLDYKYYNVKLINENMMTFLINQEITNLQFIFSKYQNIHCKFAKLKNLSNDTVYCVVITRDEDL
jgi:uncharacterized protein YaaN involved in tellurite resistance